MFFKNFIPNRKVATPMLVFLIFTILYMSSGIANMVTMNSQRIKPDPKIGHKKSQVNKKGLSIAARGGLKSPSEVAIAGREQLKNSNNFANNKPGNNIKTSLQYRPIPESDLPMLARIIHAEAGGEPLTGQVAVGAVLLNRIKSGRFPQTLAANIFRAGEFESVSNGYIWSAPTSISYKAARLALQGWDPTYGALYFFNPAKTNSRWIWSRPINVVIGKHNFAS